MSGDSTTETRGMMKFGLLFRPQSPPDGSGIVRRWEETLSAAEVAETSGFDGLFLPEHHGWADGYVPQPLVGLGALAAVTDRVDLGTAVMWLPIRHPIHVAEEGAMVDVLAGGRLRLGLGMGSIGEEYGFFGLDTSHRVSKFVEGVDLIERAWRGEELEHSGHYRASGRISPLPVDAKLWLGAMFEPGARRAARLGYPWLTEPLRDLDLVEEMCNQYWESAGSSPQPENNGIVLLRDGWIAETREEVEEVWWPPVRDERWQYFSAVPSLSSMNEQYNDPESFTFDSHRANRLIAGTPEECLQAVEECFERLNPIYLIISMRMAAGPSFEREVEALRLFGSEVIAPFKARHEL
jgi:alkanesulfonate monooxygenase SsuD/methylene tetrahydromethanopterin reductase-like flavin-dependent oxidoreductase (luciferase family)